MMSYRSICLAAVLAAGMPFLAAARPCGKNSSALMTPFLPKGAPVFQLGRAVASGEQLDADTVLSLTGSDARHGAPVRALVASRKAILAVQLVIGGKVFDVTDCTITVPGRPGLQGFQVAASNVNSVAVLLKKGETATLRIRPKGKEPQKIYLAELKQ